MVNGAQKNVAQILGGIKSERGKKTKFIAVAMLTKILSDTNIG